MKHISSLHLSLTEPSISNILMPVLKMVSLVDLSLDLRGCTIECVMPYFVFPPLPGATAPIRRIKKLHVEGEGPIILNLIKYLGLVPSLTVLEVNVHSDRTVLFPFNSERSSTTSCSRFRSSRNQYLPLEFTVIPPSKRAGYPLSF